MATCWWRYETQLELAERWYPYGRHVPVVLDPKFAGGQITIEGRGIRKDTITTRFSEYEESVEFIGARS